MDIYNQTIYNKDLSIKYNRYFLSRFLLTRFSFLFVVVIVATIYMYFIHMIEYILVLWGIFAFNLLILLLLNMISSSKSAKEFEKNEINMEYHFLDESFLVSEVHQNTEKEVSYQELKKIIQTKYFILGYFKKSPVPMILVKSGFNNEQDMQFLYTFLIKKIRSNK